MQSILHYRAAPAAAETISIMMIQTFKPHYVLHFLILVLILVLILIALVVQRGLGVV